MELKYDCQFIGCRGRDMRSKKIKYGKSEYELRFCPMRTYTIVNVKTRCMLDPESYLFKQIAMKITMKDFVNTTAITKG